MVDAFVHGFQICPASYWSIIIMSVMYVKIYITPLKSKCFKYKIIKDTFYKSFYMACGRELKLTSS